MNIVSAEEMASIDKETIETFGLNSLTLMENAARSVLPHVPEGNVGVLVGPGNNGGDGLVIARALHEQGRAVEILDFSQKKSADCEVQARLAKDWKVPITPYYEADESALGQFLADKDVVIDALFGTGLSRPLEGRYRQAVEALKVLKVIAIDIPSGIHGSTGQTQGSAVQADRTVTFGCLKRGHVLYPGRSHCGELVLTQPGFHPEALSRYDKVKLLDCNQANKLAPKPWSTMHKGDNGRLLLVTGSLQYPGAGILSALGAIRGGAGLVTHCLPVNFHNALLSWAPEVMPVAREDVPELEGYNALVLGSGLGLDSDLGRELLLKSSLPTVVDADCLDFVAELPNKANKEMILTPHPGELARMTGLSSKELQDDRIEIARRFAREFDSVLCFKGAPTVIASPDGRAFVCTTGNPVLAQGGTGDLLAGLIGAYLAFGIPCFEAASLGCHIHGLAADLASTERGQRGVSATLVSEYIPKAHDLCTKGDYANAVFFQACL